MISTIDPTPAPRSGHTIPDVSDQNNLSCAGASPAPSPKPEATGKVHQEAVRSPAHPDTRIFCKEVANESLRSPVEAISDMQKAQQQEITSEEEKVLSRTPQKPERSPAAAGGPILHEISDEAAQ